MFTTRRPLWILAFAATLAAVSLGVWHLAWRGALAQLAAKAQSDLDLASDRLTSHLFRTRDLVVVLAEHPVLVARLEGRGEAAAANALLREVADKTGASSLALVGRSGRIVAASDPGLVGQALDRRRQPLLRALNGALGTASRIEGRADGQARRLFAFAAPVFAAPGPARGAVIAEVDVLRFEQNWPTSPAVVFFTDGAGRVIVSNRSEVLLRDRTGPGFLGHAPRRLAGHDIWRLDAGPYLPAEALHLSQSLPVIGLSAEILAATAPARHGAALQAAVAAALVLVFGAFLFLAAERRRTLAEANAQLEGRVAERTAALVAANAELTREIGERREAEAALKQAQADLVQAGKLGALGQMSAGISHELNQPLMAIRSFAENAAQFLKRGDPEKAARNLGRISDLARRMGRIIQNLRAFARNEAEPVGRVDLVQVIENAAELTASHLAREGVALDWTPPPAPLFVRAGDVRLTQVFVNLITNSADAMTGQAGARRIRIDIARAGGRLAVHVTDTGPGIAEPEKVFEPFYTTKEVGSGEGGEGGEGMGLGLSISYGLVQSFGGNIRARNTGEGACFSVELETWDEREAAA